ncbi:cdc42 effector protein 5 [Hyperolius riggenbachi]|uniref:cdc42 effector protein 5 n=1 Tax=Hyperolius riggenbachi TaxID=752182 RepID=UPI0035A3CDD9
MPILKQSSSHSKKRTRIDREMISAPLGDFRHTMHVGRGGDVFGDTSFLSNHGPSSAPMAEAPSSKKNGHLKMGGDPDESKMADSLSQLSQSSGIGSGAGSVSSSPVNNIPAKEDNLWNNNSSGGHSDQVDWLSPDCGLKHAESMLSFHLDLGPSILDDVLGVMERDPPAFDWNSPDDQYDYKFSPVNVADSDKLTQSSSIIESQSNHYSLASTLPITSPGLDYNSSIASENQEGNRSAYEGDSEEEKRSIYEGVADSPAQHENNLHISHRSELDDDDDDEDEDDEEVGQGYTFEEDLDDEIGV